MADPRPPRLNKLPFWFADAMLLFAAATLVAVGGRPLRFWEMMAVAACVALGGWLAVLPFLKDHETATKFVETDRLADTAARLGQLEAIADRIAGATSQWQGVQDRARETTETADRIVSRLTKEAEAFASAVSRTADSEKQTLKLEIDKLRRSEGEWIQVAGRMMDHVFALHLAAVRSGQASVAAQVERFHGACREILRRVGFVPMVAQPDEPFDPRRHQLPDGATPPPGAVIDETVAPGYLFQGQWLRPIVVRVAGQSPDPAASGDSESEGGGKDAVGGDPASALAVATSTVAAGPEPTLDSSLPAEAGRERDDEDGPVGSA